MRAYLLWCAERRREALKANRTQVELYVRWMQEARRFQPSTSAPGCRGSPASAAHRRGLESGTQAVLTATDEPAGAEHHRHVLFLDNIENR